MGDAEDIDYAESAKFWKGVAEEATRAFNDSQEEVAELNAALGQVIDERDCYHGAADHLAYAIAPAAVIGEHSSLNDPWANAIGQIAELQAKRDRLEQQVAAVQRIHFATASTAGGSNCGGCSHFWPCPTQRALDAEPADTPAQPEPCFNCAASYNACTKGIYSGGKACCTTCYGQVTHNQKDWERANRSEPADNAGQP